MYHGKAFSTAALALAAGVLLMPAGTFARGGGGFHGGGRGPIFGFPHARIGVHRPLGPGFVRRVPGRFGFGLNAFRLHRGNQRNDASAIYPYYGDGSYGGGYGSNDATGSIAAPGPGFLPLPPASSPPEHVGCLARSYDVPAEAGGMTKVKVTRC